MSEEIFDYKPLLAEMIATFGLVFIGGMAVLHNEMETLGVLGVAAAHTLILAFMVYFSGPISGGHVNPAVTLSFVATRKMDGQTGLFYILSQFIGSILAGLAILGVAGQELLGNADGGSELGFPHLAANYSPIFGVLLELILTFFLVFVFWAVTVDDKIPDSIYGIAIGGTLGLGILAGGPLTGAALNPARVFGPALLELDFANHWIYWIGPIIGGLIAGFLYDRVFLSSEQPEE